MNETEEEQNKRLLREVEGKNVAYYSALVSAWIETRMERDRALIALSSAAIGLMVTILAAIGVIKPWLILLYFAGFALFTFCITTCLKIFQLNSELIEQAIKSTNEGVELKEYDTRSYRAFIFGVLILCIIGLSTAYLKHEEKLMSGSTDNDKELQIKSLNGLGNVKPPQPKPIPNPPSSTPPEGQKE